VDIWRTLLDTDPIVTYEFKKSIKGNGGHLRPGGGVRHLDAEGRGPAASAHDDLVNSALTGELGNVVRHRRSTAPDTLQDPLAVALRFMASTLGKLEDLLGGVELRLRRLDLHGGPKATPVVLLHDSRSDVLPSWRMQKGKRVDVDKEREARKGQ